MEKSTISKLIIYFQNSFSGLGVQADNQTIEQLTLLIHNSLSAGKRKFHSSDHIFKICEALNNPLQILATLFHDMVYFQIDGGFPIQTEELLLQYVSITDHEIYIKSDYPADKSFELCMDVFRFKSSQKLSPFNGLNEFLSAFVAAKSLDKLLETKELLCIIVCIEATIPFILSDETGKSHFEKLEQILTEVNQKYVLHLAEDSITQMVKLALEIANLDVKNFSDEDPGSFLNNTWMLISESNSNLSALKAYSYSIVHYREALTKTEGFLSFLNPNTIFHQYKGSPQADVFAQMTEQAHKNLKIGREYLAVKVLTMSILEAMAMLTGGDVPLAMFTGDIREGNNLHVERAEDYLPISTVSESLLYNQNVLNLLENGRTGESDFDMNRSPLSAFIYKSLGSEKTKTYLGFAKEMFEKKITYQDFLDKIDKKIVGEIAKACSIIALTRRESLQKFI